MPFSTAAFGLGFLACALIVAWARDCIFANQNLACYRKPTCGRAWPPWKQRK